MVGSRYGGSTSGVVVVSWGDGPRDASQDEYATGSIGAVPNFLNRGKAGVSRSSQPSRESFKIESHIQVPHLEK